MTKNKSRDWGTIMLVIANLLWVATWLISLL